MFIIPNVRHVSSSFLNATKKYFSTSILFHNNLNSYDIVISGGGLVGCSLACAIGSASFFSGKHVLLLESSNKTEYPIDPDKYSNRVCAINPGTKLFFESIGAWDKISNKRFKEVKKMKVWESCSEAQMVFQYPDMKNEVAYIIENDVMMNAFNQRLIELQDKIEVSRGIRALSYGIPSDSKSEMELVYIKLDDGREIQTKLLIGADGIHSNVRKTMGVKYIHWNYNQKGIVATVRLSEPTENVVAWQRFLPSGPIALLPLTDELCSLVWTVSLPMCDKLLRITDEEFVDSLNSFLWSQKYKNPVADSAVSFLNSTLSTVLSGRESVRQLPPSILSIEPKSRAAFPLGFGHASEYVVSRVALVGDAAHRVHPLAGQGVNLGFGDAKCLVECLEKSVQCGYQIGNFNALQDYETKRQRHVVPTMIAIDGLNRIYGTEFTPIVVLRSLGVTLFDSMNWFKGKVMNHAASS